MTAVGNGPRTTAAERVQAVLDRYDLSAQVVTLSASTRTAAEAAAAIGCEVGQIAKSLIFRTRDSAMPILVVASGLNRVNERALPARLGNRVAGERIVRADALYVREVTGFAIGGVPPVGHRIAPLTVIDADLMGYRTVWAAAGTPHAVFSIRPDDLVRICAGRVETIT